ncbi:hypothetical protein COBT_003301, partial [Conglomerata obtusa]
TYKKYEKTFIFPEKCVYKERIKIRKVLAYDFTQLKRSPLLRDSTLEAFIELITVEEINMPFADNDPLKTNAF